MNYHPANKTAPISSEILAELLRSYDMQTQQYEGLVTLTREESAWIRSGAVTEIQAIIEQKQILIDRITEEDHRMAPVLERWDSMQSEASDEDKASLYRRIKRLTCLLEMIHELEKQNEEELRQQAEILGAQLREISQRKSAFNAYQGISTDPGAVSSESRFLDRKE